MRQIKQEAFFTGTSAQGSKARSGNDSFRDTSGRSSRVRGYFSALGNGPVSARHARASCNPNLPPPHSRRLDHHADGAGQVPRSSNRFGTVLALLTALFVMALWAPPAQAAPPGEPMYLSTQWLGASVKLTWNRLYDTTITKYQERHKSGSDLDSSDSWNDIPDSGPSTANHTFTGLTNDTEYQFQVRAVNADGNGVDSEIVTATPNAAAPRVASIKRGKDGQGQDIGSPTNYFLLRWLVTFSEPVHIDPTDFLISIGGRNEHPSLALSGTSETTWSVSRRGSVGAHNGDVTLSFTASPNIKDFAGVKLTNTTPTTGTNEHTFTVDNTAPTVKSITRQTETTLHSQTDADEVTWRVTFSEGVKNVVAADFKVSGTTATLAVAADGTSKKVYDVTASGGDLATLNATVTLDFKTGYSIEDLTGLGNRAGNALSSTVVSGTNQNTYAISNTGPGQPGGFTATAGNAQVSLNWTDPSDSTIDNYEIRQKAGTAAFGTWADITSSSDTTTTHTVTSLTNGTTYGFQIRAVDDSTNAGPASDTVTATPSTDFMPVLTAITPKRYVQGAAVDFTLPAATGGDGHPSYTYTLTPDVSTGSGLTFTASTRKLTGTPSAPKAKVSYTYKAAELSANDSAPDSDSKTFTIGIAPKKPANFTATEGDAEVTLFWTDIAGVAGWEVKQDTGSWTAISSSDATTNSHTISSLINGTAYRFNVRAFVGDGSAMPSTRVDSVASDDVLVTPAKDKVPVLWNQINRVFLQGSEITDDKGDFTLALNGDGHPNYTYTLTPAPPTGLTFVVPVDPESPPKLTGMPSAPLAKTSYIYTAAEKTDDDGATESTSKTFTIGVRPMMPVNFIAAAGDTEVTLSWTAIPGVTYWWYQHTSVTTPWVPIAGDSGTANSHSVTGLTNNTEYQFRIITAVGTTTPTVLYSSATDWVEVIPVPDPIPALPVIADQSYTQGTAVDFPLPTATGGDGDGYTYTLTPASPAGLTFNASTRKLTGTPTAPLAKTTYTYTATETNDSDGANESASKSFTIGIKPQKPANFTAAAGDTKVTLAWTAIASVSGWEYKHSPGINGGVVADTWTAISGSSASTAGHTVTGLTNGTDYSFKVRAHIGSGGTLVNGDESAAETATPSDDLVPALPTITDKTYVQDMAVDFTLPAATGGDGHPNYTYALTPDVRDSGLTFTASTHKLTGTPSAPKAKVSYTYTATELSDSDETVESASKTFTIGIQPQKPANFTAAAGNTEVTLAWTAIAGVAKWQVSQKTGSGSFGNWTDITGSGGATTSHTVASLTNGTVYSFKVRAVVGTGDAEVIGVESDSVTVTPADVLTVKITGVPSRINKPFKATFEFFNAVADFVVGDITTENATVSGFAGSGKTYTALITPTSEGEFKVYVEANAATDSANKENLASDIVSGTYDTTRPTVEITGVPTSATTTEVFTATFTFSEKVNGFTAGDISVTNGARQSDDLTTVSEKTTYTVTIRPDGKGVPVVSVGASKVTDEAGNGNVAADSTRRVEPPPPPANRAPVVAKGIPDDTVEVGGTVEVSLGGVFTDPDGDSLTVTAESSDTQVASVSAGGSALMVTGISDGEAAVTVTADDGRGGKVSDNFTITVNPAAGAPAAPVRLTVVRDGEEAALSWTNANDDSIEKWQYRYRYSASPWSEWKDIAGSGSETTSYTVTGLDAETTYRFQLRAVNASGIGSASAPGEAAPNSAPVVTKPLGDLELETGNGAVTISLSGVFTDPDGDELTVTAESSDTQVASVSAGGSALMVTGAGVGAATVTVTARDEKGAMTTDSFTVTVKLSKEERQERSVLKKTLAAIAQATLSGASGAIERRFSSSLGSGGFTLTGGVTELLPSETEGTPQADSFDQWDEEVMDSRDMDVENMLQSAAFELSSGNEAAAWTLWGRGDLTQFEGRPDGGSYDGSLRSGWLGFDARVNGNILAGLAVSRSSGDADYGFGDNGGGELETDLTSVHPYAQIVTSGGGSLRVLGGVGRGEIRRRASDGDIETRDLKMNMVSAGARLPVLRGGSLSLSVKGDTGLARLETDGDGEAGGIGGLRVDAWRIRGGVEVAHDGLRLSESGMTLSPLGSLSLRHDGGDGITGTGVEVEGGVRLGSGGSRFGLEARGRWLALHTEDGYGERGMSLEARITPGAGGRGLSLSVGPQWGAAVEGTDALWQEEAFVRGSGSQVNKEASLAARAGYGFGISGGVLTPFVEMDVSEGESERRRYGTGVELGLWNIHGRTLDAALAGERLEGSSLEPENRIGLDLRMSF